jgi:hypothetical protein
MKVVNKIAMRNQIFMERKVQNKTPQGAYQKIFKELTIQTLIKFNSMIVSMILMK